MERWAIKNRTAGTVEIGCVRSAALLVGETYIFEGPPPDKLRWLVGEKKIYLFPIDIEPKTLPSSNSNKPTEGRRKLKVFDEPGGNT
jgi:hypothetical protein